MAESFKSAFAAARKAGKKAFTWNGKSYNTELAETVRPKPRGSGEPMRPRARVNTNDPGKNPKPKSLTDAIFPSSMSSIRSDLESERRKRERARNQKDATREANRGRPKPRPAPKVERPIRDSRRDKSNPVGFDFDAQREAAKKKKKK